MVDKFPVEPTKRKRIEVIIRIIDTIAYAVIFFGGVYALFFTPSSVLIELREAAWLIPFWSSLLLIGGLLGFVGRISTIWLLEPPADVASAMGILIYIFVLGKTAFESITAAVATCLMVVALLSTIRRYLELQLFGSDPTNRDFRSKLNDTLSRRIPNVPPRG